MEVLAKKAMLLRESLQKSQSNTENMVGILGSFDYRLSALDTAMRPTQVSSIVVSRFMTKRCDLVNVFRLIYA